MRFWKGQALGNDYVILDREAEMAKVYRFDFKQLDVYQAAVLHFRWCLEVAARIPADRKVLMWQMLRAALSVMLNIGEAGGRRVPGEAAQYLRVAQGSAYECAAMLDALAAMAVIDDDAYNAQEEVLARIGAMLTVMIRNKSTSKSKSKSKSIPSRGA